MAPAFRRSPLALAVLGLLEVGPMHPYAIQRLIRQWGKDQVVNVGQRATLYKMIGRLDKAGLIAVRASDRNQQYPERTTYEVTPAGTKTARQWLSEILSTPRNEFPEFPAALSFIPMLTPEMTRDLLSRRRDLLVTRIEQLDAALTPESKDVGLPRVTLLESEYLRAITAAELAWLDGILDGLADGSINWSREQLMALQSEWPLARP